MKAESEASTSANSGLHAGVTGAIITAAMKVHTALGPGLVESCYEVCLAHELSKRGFRVQRQLELPVRYDGVLVDAGYRMDLVVNGCVVVELKAIERFAPIHDAVLHTYLKLSGHRVGLMINFNVVSLKDGLRRRVL